MPRKVEQLIENKFTKGLVTEATGLSFPEHAAVEMWDCVPEDEGVVRRRRGFDYETDYEFDNYDRNESVVTSYLWKSAAGDPNVNIVVAQVGDTLYYYSLNSSSISPGKETFTTDLDAKKISGATTLQVSSSLCDFAQIDGKLYVTHPRVDPFYVTYSSAPSITETTITIKIRDLEGATSDPYEVDERPVTTIDSADIQHMYNLWNQGWANDVNDSSDNDVNPVTEWDSAKTTVPSNADRWWMYKNAADKMDTDTIERVTWSTGPAAKGYFILDAFNMDRNAVTNSHGISMDTEYTLTGETQAANSIDVNTSGTNRPRTVAAFSSRIFYAGVNSAGYNNRIYFSQVLTDSSKSGFCYQKNDPTDQNFSDLIADDGGVIIIPEAATIYKIAPLKNSILIFASNGIWSLQGSEGLGFSATDFSIEKLSSEGAISRSSFVDVEGVPIWWNWNGIFTVAESQGGLGSSSVKNMTDETIQTFFDAIPGESKLYATGAYNPSEKVVHWLWKSTKPSEVSERHLYDRVLCLNVRTGAFYPWTIDTSTGVDVQGIINIEGVVEASETSNVLVTNLDTVVDSSVATVTTNASITQQIDPFFKYFCGKLSTGTTYSYTFADLGNTSLYADWITEDGAGIEYTSYFISGYALPGNAITESQMNYVNVYTNTLTGSSLLVSTLWDYVNTTSDKRWTGTQQGYKHDANHNVSIRRLKIRGKGQALQLQMKSSGVLPFEVLGWSTKILVDQSE